MKHTFVLHNPWALGDTVCLSALVRDIQKAHPGKYELLMSGHYSKVYWRNNPHAQWAGSNPRGQLIQLCYKDGIRAAGRGSKIHFLSWFHTDFQNRTGIKVPVTEPKGEIYLTPDELAKRPEGRYWVVIAGGKLDMTAKVWSTAYWQRTVDTLRSYGIRCVQAGGTFARHFHPTLHNVEQYVGQTRNERDFFALIAGAEGVICGITGAMHIAAVYDKPCVVIAGGREEPWWEGYVDNSTFGPACAPVKMPHKFLHTVGGLDCGIGNEKKGCWRDRTVALEQTDFTLAEKRIKLCVAPVTIEQQAVPKCLTMITPDHVVEAVMRYYEDGMIPPIGQPTGKYPLQVFDAPVSEPEPVWTPAWEKQLPATAQPRAGEPAIFSTLDHPYIGGKFTLFALSFGDELPLLERCLGSIINTCPRHRYDLRVALNKPSPGLSAYVRNLHKDGIVSKIYETDQERRKYPAMREMFWDKDHPITTPYLCWFDDDSWCRKEDWMVRLAQAILLNHNQQGRLYGYRVFHDLATIKRPDALKDKWFKTARWWRGRHLYSNNGRRLTPNGSQIVFASGGFWALSTEVMRSADIPDVRLNHNGGDATIGCQVTQAGFKVVDFSPRPAKEIIAWSDAPRRGYSENFPWA